MTTGAGLDEIVREIVRQELAKIQTASPAPDRLLTVPEAATMLAVPESHLYEMVRQGRFPSVRIGKKYRRIRLADVQAAMVRTA